VEGQQHTANINSFLDGAMNAYATANNGHLPKTIIVYRAGLNRSQQVLKEADDYIAELDRMWEANAAGVAKPCITIIHTSKRSAIRLFKKQGSFHDNCGAGTVIDDGITSSAVFDFELVANNTKFAPLLICLFYLPIPQFTCYHALSLQQFLPSFHHVLQQNWTAHAYVCPHQLQSSSRARQLQGRRVRSRSFQGPMRQGLDHQAHFCVVSLVISLPSICMPLLFS
jgi:hypothetical protein